MFSANDTGRRGIEGVDVLGCSFGQRERVNCVFVVVCLLLFYVPVFSFLFRVFCLYVLLSFPRAMSVFCECGSLLLFLTRCMIYRHYITFIISVLHISFDCSTVLGLFSDNCVIYILDIYNDIVDHCIYTLLI